MTHGMYIIEHVQDDLDEQTEPDEREAREQMTSGAADRSEFSCASHGVREARRKGGREYRI